MRFVGERRALAAAVLAFFMIQLFLTGLLVEGQLRLLFFALGLAYGTGFVGVVAGYFWARWYSLGLAFSGMTMAVTAVLRGVDAGPVLYILFGTHAAISLGLLGQEAASFYDGRRDWRERLKMDDNAVNRLGKAITRAGASLPYLIVLGLGPKEPGEMKEIVGILALGSAALGISALIRARTVGLVGLAVAAVAAAGVAIASGGFLTSNMSTRGLVASGAPGVVAAVLLVAALAPFARPVIRHLKRPY